jgi:hypothetical protein
MHNRIADQFGVAEDAPCADFAYLTPLKRSHQYRQLRPRLLGKPPHPVFDSWLDDGFHFFVFQLRPGPGRPEALTGLAVFAMHPDMEGGPVSAITVEPTEDGHSAEITDLRLEGSTYVAPLPQPPTE